MESDPRTKWSAADLLRTTVGDHAMFMISVMNNEGVSQQIAAQRQKITRNLIAPEAESVLCEDAGDPANCKVAMGFGLGWRIVEINVEINNETILDHTGADSDVKTFAFFIPKRKTGAIIFTDGPNVGHQMIDKVLGILYPNRIYDATPWLQGALRLRLRHLFLVRGRLAILLQGGNASFVSKKNQKERRKCSLRAL